MAAFCTLSGTLCFGICYGVNIAFETLDVFDEHSENFEVMLWTALQKCHNSSLRDKINRFMGN